MYNTLCALGVCQFLPHVGYNGSYLAATVVTNGILFHAFGGKPLLWWDTIANTLMILYTNFITKSQPFVLFFSILAMATFCFNSSNLWHVVGVQGCLNLALWCHYLEI